MIEPRQDPYLPQEHNGRYWSGPHIIGGCVSSRRGIDCDHWNETLHKQQRALDIREICFSQPFERSNGGLERQWGPGRAFRA